MKKTIRFQRVITEAKSGTIYVFDFDGTLCKSDGFFPNKLINPKPIESNMSKLKSHISKGDDVMVLSARDNSSVIRDFLNDNGIESIKIRAIGDGSKFAKGKFMKNNLTSKYERIVFYDDNKDYIEGAKEIMKDSDTSLEAIKV